MLCALLVGIRITPANAIPSEARTDFPTVVATILPVASLVSGVLGDKGSVVLLIPPGQTPHTFSLKPSQARTLSKADALVWVGPGLESFLPPLLASLPANAITITLADTEGLDVLPLRQGETWIRHSHDHDHDHDHDEDAETTDQHLWLDPANARLWVRALASTFSQAYPANADTYFRNAALLEFRLSGLEEEMKETLDPLRDKAFVVTHDFTQYLERRFGVHAIGSITPDPAIPSSARHISELRQRIIETGAVCLFAEPQLDDRLLKTVSEGTRLRHGILDPLGRDADITTEGYFTTLQTLTRSLASCLSQDSAP